MRNKPFEDQIMAAIRLSLSVEGHTTGLDCPRYGPVDFDAYWEGLLQNGEKLEMEEHCLGCPACLGGLARARDLEEETNRIAAGISDEPLLRAARELLEKKKVPVRRRIGNRNLPQLGREPVPGHTDWARLAWAAAASLSGGQGEAQGVAATDRGNHDQATMIECSAWVGDEILAQGKLELWGMQVEATDDGVPATKPLAYLEEKLQGLFRVNPLLRSFNLDRRLINVDLKERVLREANSLCLAIVVAILAAVHRRQKEDVPRAYSADLRQDGKLEGVGRIRQKLKAARDSGIREFVLARENEGECPPEFLKDPNLTVRFFDHLHELLAHLGFLPESCGTARLDPTIRTRRSGICEHKGRPGEASGPKAAQPDASEWGFILELTTRLGMDAGLARRLLACLEDVCQSRSLEGVFSTVVFLGSTERVRMLLPDSGLAFASSTSLPENPDSLARLVSVVNGRDLGFVVGTDGMFEAICKVDVELGRRAEISPLLIGANHRYACLSLATGALVFYFPPTGRHAHLFSGGEMLGKYLNGRWQQTPYADLEQALRRAAETHGCDWPALRKAARAAVAMAERGQGAIFAFVEDGGKAAGKVESRLDAVGLRFEKEPLEHLSEEAIINLAKEDGAVLVDRQGLILAFRAHLLSPRRGRPAAPLGPSTRHHQACLFSRSVGGIALVASRYGTVTLYDNGKEIVCL